MNVMRLAREERTDLAEFLGTLSPDQWNENTLCDGWRVRDVVAHLISYDGLTGAELFGRLSRAQFLPNRANAVGVSVAADRSPEELLVDLNAHLDPKGLTAGFGGRIGLLDGLIHHQDIRRGLGTPREVPAERLAPAMAFARIAPPIGAIWRARGLRLVATDLNWSAGRGPEVTGPAEPLLLAIAGRKGVVAELSGPGQPTLATRIGG